MRIAVFNDFIRSKDTSIHGNKNAAIEHLNSANRAANIKYGVGLRKRGGLQCTSEYNGP